MPDVVNENERRFTPKDLRVNHVYRGDDGRTRKILSIGRGPTPRVDFRDSNPKRRSCTAAAFAEWARVDVTPASVKGAQQA